MLYMSKIANYLKILTDEKVKDLVLIYFGGYFKSVRENLHSKLSEEKHLEKLLNCFHSF